MSSAGDDHPHFLFSLPDDEESPSPHPRPILSGHGIDSLSTVRISDVFPLHSSLPDTGPGNGVRSMSQGTVGGLGFGGNTGGTGTLGRGLGSALSLASPFAPTTTSYTQLGLGLDSEYGSFGKSTAVGPFTSFAAFAFCPLRIRLDQQRNTLGPQW